MAPAKEPRCEVEGPPQNSIFLPQTLFAGAAAPRFSPQDFLGSAFCNHSTRRRRNEEKDILTNSENEERMVDGVIAIRKCASLTLIRVVSIVRALVVLSFCFVPALFWLYVLCISLWLPRIPHFFRPFSLLAPLASLSSGASQLSNLSNSYKTPLIFLSNSSPCSLICLKWLSRLIINLLSSPPSLLFLISLRGPADFSELLQVRKMPQKGPWVPTRGGGAHSLILVGPPRYKDLCWAVDLLLTKIFSSASS